MITLDPTTWEYASKMDNFSGWVRSKLMEEMARQPNRRNTSSNHTAFVAICGTNTRPRMMRNTIHARSAIECAII